MQHDNFLGKKVLTFDYIPGVEGVCKDGICAAGVVLYAPFPSNLICKMTTFRNRIVLSFDPTPGQNMCLHVTAFAITFNLICNITAMF